MGGACKTCISKEKWASEWKTCGLVRREVLYNIFIEFGIPQKIVRLIEMRQMKCIAESRYATQIEQNEWMNEWMNGQGM